MSKIKKRKICVVVASRANYGRIRSTLFAIKKHKKLELQIVASASAILERFGSVIDIIRQDGFKVNSIVYTAIEGDNPITMAKSTGLGIIELSNVFDDLKPDYVLTVADRYETMATAIAASYMNIVLVHTQGGEVTGSIDESVRHSITKLAHVHFPSTELSAKRLIKMGEKRNSIFNVGCPSIDTIKEQDLDISSLTSFNLGVGAKLNPKEPFILVVQHPVTTEYKKSKDEINETIKAIELIGMQTFWLWPNIDSGSDLISKSLRVFREKKSPNYVQFIKNMTPKNYNILLSNAKVAVGNSSSFIREGAYLGLPTVNIGTRQNTREKSSNVIEVLPKKIDIINAIKKQLNHGRYKKSKIFGDGNAGKKIANILSKINPKIQKKIDY
jgi:UDP-hydrolysing UDP-N-acetyl-D-glucosamine 2-epimerase